MIKSSKCTIHIFCRKPKPPTIGKNEIFILVVFSMIVPSFDNFSDVRLSILFATGTYTPAGKFYLSDITRNWENIEAVPQYKYAIFTFLPVFISFLFTLRHWYHIENTKRKKLKSMPFLIFGLWPQYRVGRILHFFRKNNKKWIKEKDLFETELSTLGIMHFANSCFFEFLIELK